MDTWHARLRFAREQTGLRQMDAAKKVGVSGPSFSDWESGKTKKIEGENLVKVCDLLKISPKWLLFGQGEMFQQAISKDDWRAINISRNLGEKERRAWYRAGDTLIEPDGDDGDEPKQSTQ